MTAEANKAIPRRFFQAMQSNDQAALKALLAPDFKAYHFGANEPIRRDIFLQMMNGYEGTFSDQKYTIVDQVAEGDRVTTRTTWEGTHIGEYEGLAPTGRRVKVSGISIARIADGQIVERWIEIDRLGWLQQLGLVPPPQPQG